MRPSKHNIFYHLCAAQRAFRRKFFAKMEDVASPGTGANSFLRRLMSSRASRPLTLNGLKNQIGDRCRLRRQEINLKQDALCGRLAMVTEGDWIADRREIGRIENGSRYVTTLELEALARALDVRASWLLQEDTG